MIVVVEAVEVSGHDGDEVGAILRVEIFAVFQA